MHCALQISYQAEAAWHLIKIPDDYATLIVPTNTFIGTYCSAQCIAPRGI